MQTGHDNLPSGFSSHIRSLADERVILRRGESSWPPRQSRYSHHSSASSQPGSSAPVSSRLYLAVATPLLQSGPILSPQWDALDPTDCKNYRQGVFLPPTLPDLQALMSP